MTTGVDFMDLIGPAGPHNGAKVTIRYRRKRRLWQTIVKFDRRARRSDLEINTVEVDNIFQQVVSELNRTPPTRRSL